MLDASLLIPGLRGLAQKTKDFYVGGELELGLIQTQMAQKPMLRAEVGSGNARALRKQSKKQVRYDSGGRGAWAKFLGKFAKSEVFVGVAHSAEQQRRRRASKGAPDTRDTRSPLGRGQSVPFSAQGAYCSAPEP
jgi:hypothetical protein